MPNKAYSSVSSVLSKGSSDKLYKEREFTEWLMVRKSQQGHVALKRGLERD